MSIQFHCSSCQSELRVPDEHAGRKARCPQCKNVNLVPQSSTVFPSPPVEGLGGSAIAPTAGFGGTSDPGGSVSAGLGGTVQPAQPTQAVPPVASAKPAVNPTVNPAGPGPSYNPTAAPANPYNTPGFAPAGAVAGFAIDTGSRGQYHEFMPLYECVFFLRLIGWFSIVAGVLYCLTIVGIIIGWLPIWMGMCLKNAADSFDRGYPANDSNALLNGAKNLSTFFKIIGVLTIINIVIFCLYLLFFVVVIIGGVGAGFG